MAKKQKNNTQETPEFRERVSDQLRRGEEAAQYLHGLADAFEAMGAKGALVHHLKCHAHELDQGTLWVNHAYPTGKAGT